MTRASRYILTAQKRNETLTYTGTLEEILNQLENEALQFNDSSMFCRSTRDIINLERDYGNEAAFYSYDANNGEEDAETRYLWFSDEHLHTKAAMGFMERVARTLEATETYQRSLEVTADEDEEREVLRTVTLRNRPLMLTPDTLCAYAEYVLDTAMSLITCVPVAD
jgi:hypothetical protein